MRVRIERPSQCSLVTMVRNNTDGMEIGMIRSAEVYKCKGPTSASSMGHVSVVCRTTSVGHPERPSSSLREGLVLSSKFSQRSDQPFVSPANGTTLRQGDLGVVATSRCTYSTVIDSSTPLHKVLGTAVSLQSLLWRSVGRLSCIKSQKSFSVMPIGLGSAD